MNNFLRMIIRESLYNEAYDREKEKKLLQHESVEAISIAKKNIANAMAMFVFLTMSADAHGDAELRKEVMTIHSYANEIKQRLDVLAKS